MSAADPATGEQLYATVRCFALVLAFAFLAAAFSILPEYNIRHCHLETLANCFTDHPSASLERFLSARRSGPRPLVARCRHFQAARGSSNIGFCLSRGHHPA